MFKWGNKSLALLEHVHPDLAQVLTEALASFSTVDVSVIETLRTLETQKQYIDKGVSQTLKTRHRLAKGEYCKAVAHAADIVALKDNRSTDDPAYYYAFAEAVRLAAVRLNISVTFGGFWMPLNQVVSIAGAADEYRERCARENRKPFLDLGHYELSWSVYPAIYVDEE